MNKLEAATFLDISVRDLERHMQKGRIAYQFEKGKTRPKVVFQDTDLAVFKEEMQPRLQPFFVGSTPPIGVT